jgi:hypothetical protein
MNKEEVVSGKKLLLVGLAVVVTLGCLFVAACGGSDEGKVTMQNALSVVETDISGMEASFGTGQATGAAIKAALTTVAPDWQAVVDACDGVKGADKAKAQELWTNLETTVNGLADDAGMAQLAVVLGPVTELKTFITGLREIVGASPTTVPAVEDVTTVPAAVGVPATTATTVAP